MVTTVAFWEYAKRHAFAANHPCCDYSAEELLMAGAALVSNPPGVPSVVNTFGSYGAHGRVDVDANMWISLRSWHKEAHEAFAREGTAAELAPRGQIAGDGGDGNVKHFFEALT